MLAAESVLEIVVEATGLLLFVIGHSVGQHIVAVVGYGKLAGKG